MFEIQNGQLIFVCVLVSVYLDTKAMLNLSSRTA